MQFNLRDILLVVCISLHLHSLSAKDLFQEERNKSLKYDQFWNWNPVKSYNTPIVDYANKKQDTDEDSDGYENGDSGGDTNGEDTSGSSSSTNDDDPDQDSKNMDTQIPQVNFYSTFPASIGVYCNGMLWFRELSAAMGTPIPMLVALAPMTLFGIVILFLPDLSVLNLPLFYPSDTGDGDPLVAFPPLLDLEYNDIQKLKEAVKKLLPPPPDLDLF